MYNMERFKTLKDHVYEYIEEQIKSGSLLPEQKIDETTICNALNISRTPVREALIQLAAEEIIENRARKGFAVKQLTTRDVEELYGIIGALDGMAAKLACPKLNEKDFRDMEFYIGAMELAINSGNFEMYNKQQEIFHSIYINKCGNETLVLNIEKTRNKILTKNYIDDKEGKTRKILRSTNDEHKTLLDILKKGDEKEAFWFLSEVHYNERNAAYELGD